MSLVIGEKMLEGWKPKIMIGDFFVGQIVKIIAGGNGAFGANNKIGIVTEEKSNHGCTSGFGIKIKVSHSQIWKLHPKDYELIPLEK